PNQQHSTRLSAQLPLQTWVLRPLRGRVQRPWNPRIDYLNFELDSTYLAPVRHPSFGIQITYGAPHAGFPPIGVSRRTQSWRILGDNRYYLPPVITRDVPPTKDRMGIGARLIIRNEHFGFLRIADRIIDDPGRADHSYRRVHHIALVEREQVQIICAYL